MEQFEDADAAYYQYRRLSQANKKWSYSKLYDINQVSFWYAFYFSLVTFTTVGYGDWYPEDMYRKFVMSEGVLGWLLLALFIVTLANVMIRP